MQMCRNSRAHLYEALRAKDYQRHDANKHCFWGANAEESVHHLQPCDCARVSTGL